MAARLEIGDVVTFNFPYERDFLLMAGAVAHSGQRVEIIGEVHPKPTRAESDRLFKIKASDGWISIALGKYLEA